MKNNISKKDLAEKLADSGLMLGKMSLYDSKRNAKLGHGVTGYSMSLRFLKVDDEKEKRYVFYLRNTDDGYFAMDLPSGEYTLEYVQFRPGFVRPMTDHMWVDNLQFNRVRIEEGKATYVGDIYMEIAGKSYTENIKDSMQSVPAAMRPFEVGWAVLGIGDEHLKIATVDNFDQGVTHFQQNNDLDTTQIFRDLLKPIE